MQAAVPSLPAQAGGTYVKSMSTTNGLPKPPVVENKQVMDSLSGLRQTKNASRLEETACQETWFPWFAFCSAWSCRTKEEL